MKKMIIMACLFLLGAGCNSDDSSSDDSKPIEKPAVPRTVEMITIAQGDHLGSMGGRDFKVISDESTWNGLIQNGSISSSIVNPLFLNIDFSAFDVVLVVDEKKAPGGRSIDIVDIMEYEQNVVVRVDGLIKGNQALQLKRPFHIVKIPKLAKTVVFETVEAHLKDLKYKEIWNLREFSPGLGPYHYYEVGDIRWVFNDHNSITTQVNEELRRVSDYHTLIPLNTSGNYTYRLLGDTIFLNNERFQYRVIADTLVVHWNVPADGIELIFVRD
ncbi:hypothetical protein [Flavobacterium sp. JP2137]|uniref:hypothetical protein n=1 Tax=Flavobacterium sp. JP2137 TaxID=3414510 RepID=UPI003D2FE208